MTVEQICKELSLSIEVEGDMQQIISGGYTGDLLSWVMSRAQSGDAWITVMGNVNAVAVCVLADCACMILAEGSRLDEEAKKKAQQNGVAVLLSDLPAFRLSYQIGRLLS